MAQRREQSLQDGRIVALCMHYVTDPERRTVDFWYTQSHQNVPLEKVRHLAATENWERQRESYWRGVKHAWLKAQHLEVIRTQVEELNEIRTIRRHLFTMLQPARTEDGTEYFRVQPKSYEGAARTFGYMDQILEQKRDSALERLEPMLAEVQQAKAAADGVDEGRKTAVPFSPAEMRRLAHNMIRKRRQKTIDDDEEEDNEEDE